MESISSNEIQLRSTNSIELRRNLEMNRKYFNSLSVPDKNILRAKMETKIDSIPDQSRKQMFAVLINSIAKDVGIKQVEQYDIAALYRFIINYYSTMAFSEIKLAFDLLLVGELDKFLPESSDRKHFGTFSIDYMSRILNAYKRRSNDVVYYAITVGKSDYRINKKHLRRLFLVNFHRRFMLYKYHGRFEIMEANIIPYIEELGKYGLVNDVIITDDDRKSAANHLLYKVARGAFTPFVAETIRLKGVKHDFVEEEARLIAHKKILKDAFDYIIVNELQIKNYLKL
jgi:hypothetical protein